MKTTNKIVRKKVRTHILQSIMDSEGQEFENINDACKYAYSEFERVANYPTNLYNIPNNQDRFSDYLNGLPFNFHYYYSDIKDFLNSLGINPTNKEYTDEESQKIYHYLIYTEILKNK